MQHATNENIDETYRKKFLCFGVALRNCILLGFVASGWANITDQRIKKLPFPAVLFLSTACGFFVA